MNNKKNIIFPIFLAIGVIAGIFIGNILTKRTYRNVSYNYSSGDTKISNILNLIDSYYVDTINKNELLEKAIPKIVENLDPHSCYIPASELQSVNDELSGSFSGIGVQFNIQRDTVTIVSVITGGPSEKLGILPGDRIVTVNDSVFVGKNIKNENVIKKLRGKKGSHVKVGIKRSNSRNILNFDIVRGDIPVTSIDASYIINDNIGYIKVNRFGATTMSEFDESLYKLTERGAAKFIIDLRGNSGGFLQTAIYMINQFLEKGDLIVYTEGKNSPREESFADGYGKYLKHKIVILIDEWSASASEIFAGAIQDNDRGLIIGRRSFGKGLVQNQYELGDGSAIRLTIARYYIPSKRCIQKPYSDTTNYEEDIVNRYLHGEMYDKDSVKFDSTNSVVYKTKKGRIVYGGGGIMPDVFVPQDTTGITSYFNKLNNLGLIYEYAFAYTDSKRDILSKMASADDIISYVNNDNILEKFVEYANEKGVKRNPNMLSQSKNLISNRLNAYVVRGILGDNDFYKVINSSDKTVITAIEKINE